MGFWDYDKPTMSSDEYARIERNAAERMARRAAYIAETGAPDTIATIVPDDYTPGDYALSECSVCGSTETVEMSDETQTITICAECGSDE